MGERIERQPSPRAGRRVSQPISHPSMTKFMHRDTNNERKEQTEKYRWVS